MAQWPSSPIAEMLIQVNGVWKPPQTSIWQIDGTPAFATVLDPKIDFSVYIVMIQNFKNPASAVFRVQLDKIISAGLLPLSSASQSVSLPLQPGTYLPTAEVGREWWYHNYLTVSTTMTEPVEMYRVRLDCEITEGQDPTPMVIDLYYQAIQSTLHIGDFSLDFIPLSIVYSPPGQDMTNSLTQSTSFGTRLSLGSGSGMQAEVGINASIDVLGMVASAIGSSSSQPANSLTSTEIEISYFRTTVVTADNQKAIGRAYWGPLGDLFVILVNPRFSASARADGTIFYCAKCTNSEQVIIIPAWKLLRPGNDKVAASIPEANRRSLLALDPFITNLDRFFPDSGVDLKEAANPFADPSANNRADRIGRWWLDNGAELNYSRGEVHKLSTTQTNQLSYSATARIHAAAGANVNQIRVALALDANHKTTVTYQQSKEAFGSYTLNAACFLMRNQNDKDLDGIELFFDKIFSTFMFRRLRSGKSIILIRGFQTISGLITNFEHSAIRGLQVFLEGPKGLKLQTSTDAVGYYSFYNLEPGRYTLVAGDKRSRVMVEEEHSPLNPLSLDVTGVRRPIDLRTAALWEITDTLGLPPMAIGAIRRHGADITSEIRLAEVCGLDRSRVKEWKKVAFFLWDEKPGEYGPPQQSDQGSRAKSKRRKASKK